MSILTTIIQMGKAVIAVFVLYWVGVGIREYQKENMIQNTEQMWDIEHEARMYKDDDGEEYEWALVRRKK